MAARAITEAHDFTPFGTICGIGGGQGILLKSILTVNPHLRGILYDQEKVVKGQVLADMAALVEVQPGDFLERVPASHVLLLKNVLHDWREWHCSRCNRCTYGVSLPCEHCGARGPYADFA